MNPSRHTSRTELWLFLTPLVVFLVSNSAPLLGQSDDDEEERAQAQPSPIDRIDRITAPTDERTYLTPPRACLDATGRRVVFVSRNDPVGRNPDGGEEVFLLDTATGRTRQLTDTVGFNHTMAAVITADGETVFISAHGDPIGANPDRSCELFRVDLSLLDSGESAFQQLTESPLESDSRYGRGSRHPSTNVDGSRVVFLSREDLTGENPDGNWEVFLVESTRAGRASATIRQLTDTVRDVDARVFLRGCWRPRISGDGSTVVYARQTKTGLVELFLLDLRTNREYQLTYSTRQSVSGYSIDHSGLRIAFAYAGDLTGENRDATPELFLLELADEKSPLVQITRTAKVEAPRTSDDLGWPEISADGMTVAFTMHRDLTGENPEQREVLFSADVSDPARPVFAQLSAGEHARFPALNADGSRVAFAEQGGGNLGHDFQLVLAHSEARMFSPFGAVSVDAPAGTGVELFPVASPRIPAPEGYVMLGSAFGLAVSEGAEETVIIQFRFDAEVIATTDVALDGIGVWMLDGDRWVPLDSDSDLEQGLVSASAFDKTVTAIFGRGVSEPALTLNTPTNHALRILTYNVGLIEVLGNELNNEAFQMDDEERAVKVAEGILRADPDVVALNEGFVESARDDLIDELAGVYPYYIIKLDAFKYQDSGLILFSKWPFQVLSNLDFTSVQSPYLPPFGFWADGTANFLQVAFVQFEYYLDHYGYEYSCSDEDCLAAKGAGLVRVQSPHSGETSTVVFTHMQASNDDESDSEYALERRLQLRAIRNMTKTTLTPTELIEPIYVVGDLNIDGNLSPSHARPTVYPHHLDDTVQFYQGPEWEWNFSASGRGWYACGLGQSPLCDVDDRFLVDTWRFTSSPDDFGPTSGESLHLFEPSEGSRLDYILQNHVAGETPCVQYIRKPPEVAENGKHWSDHLPVMADINRWAAHCCPREAVHTTFAPGSPDQYLPGTITFPGSMQWYLVEDEGTYSIDTTTADVNFLVYRSDDLSHPIGPWHGEVSEWGLVFRFDEPPYYVRAFSDDPSFTGQYGMMIHQHQGTSPEDAKILVWGDDPQEEIWPQQPVGTIHTYWYKFYTNIGDAGDYPRLEFELTPEENLNDFTIKVHKDDPNQNWPEIAFQEYGHDGLVVSAATDQLVPKSNGEDRRYYLSTQRETQFSTLEKTTLTGTTNLTYFHPVSMKCVNQYYEHIV